MRRTAVLFARYVAFLSLCVSLAIGHSLAAEVSDKTPVSNAELNLRLSLRREASGEIGLHLDMPVNEATLRLLLNGQEKHPVVLLSASKGVPYGEVVKVIDLLRSLGLHKLSLASVP